MVYDVLTYCLCMAFILPVYATILLVYDGDTASVCHWYCLCMPRTLPMYATYPNTYLAQFIFPSDLVSHIWWSCYATIIHLSSCHHVCFIKSLFNWRIFMSCRRTLYIHKISYIYIIKDCYLGNCMDWKFSIFQFSILNNMLAIYAVYSYH